MADTTAQNAASEGGKQPETTPSGGEFTPITTQEDLNKVLGERLKREREKFADYDVLKQAADELKRLKDAEKSEVEKAQERIAELEKQAADNAAAATRARIQASYGISDADAELFLTATDEDALTKQAKTLAELRKPTAEGRAPVIPQIGKSGESQMTAEQQFAAIAGQMLRG